MSTRFVSKEYRCDPARVMRGIAFSWLVRHIAAVVLPLAALLAASVFDQRFIYVTLIFVFILFPMVLTMVWLRTGLSPETVRLSEPQRLIADDCGMTVEYMARDEEHPSCFAADFFEWTDFKGVSRSADFIRFEFRKHRRPAIVVPADAFAATDWQTILSRFEEYVDD